MTTKEALARLNELRVARGEQPYKAWKESRAKLDAKLATYEQPTPELATPQASLFDAAIEEHIEAAVELDKKPSKKIIGNAYTITLADIARLLNLNPKIARAKMRRIRVPEGAEVSKHTYAIDYKETIINLLKKDFRRKS